MASSSKKSRKFAKVSEILLYVGLFFFIFALAVIISLAAKGTFAPDQQMESGGLVLCALVGVFGGVGVISLLISFIFNLKAKKARNKELDEAKNKAAQQQSAVKAPVRPTINVNNVEAQKPKSPVININIPQQKVTPQPTPRVVVNTTTSRPVVTQPKPGVTPMVSRPAFVQPKPGVTPMASRPVVTQPRPGVTPMVSRPAFVQPRPGVTPMASRPMNTTPGRTVIRTADGRLISVNTGARPGTVPPRPVVR
ncbi:MAG: hypothetical protein K2H56_01670 [Malacoplasma sp.]|nr:hypothetical protein [Malacoplasma sp.]MDE7099822.1 hypothetical protein [Malacoplasma sp.]